MARDNDNLYSLALQNLNKLHNHDDNFEEVARMLANFTSEYNFAPPSGGRGRRDGGRDGIDRMNNVKLAASIQKQWHKKISDELGKAKCSGETKVIFYTNQNITEDENKSVTNAAKEVDIDLVCHGLSDVVSQIDEYMNAPVSDKTDSSKMSYLLGLSFLAECPKMVTATKADIPFVKTEYKSKVLIMYEHCGTLQTPYSSSQVLKILLSHNPLLDFIDEMLRGENAYELPNIYLKGSGFMGKSRLMKKTFNRILEEAHKGYNSKYSLLPTPVFTDLSLGEAALDVIKQAQNVDRLRHYLYFVDGLDEIGDKDKRTISGYVKSCAQNHKNVRFVIAGRSLAFIEEFNIIDHIDIDIEPLNKNDGDSDLNSLLDKYDSSPVRDLCAVPGFRDALHGKAEKTLSVNDLYAITIKGALSKDNEKIMKAKGISKRLANDLFIKSAMSTLPDFCYELFGKQTRCFCESDLRDYLNRHNEGDDFFISLLTSSMFCADDGIVRFSSNFYYEYFAAIHFSRLTDKELIEAFLEKNYSGAFQAKSFGADIFHIVMAVLGDKKREYGIFKKVSRKNPGIMLGISSDVLSSAQKEKLFKDVFKQHTSSMMHMDYTGWIVLNPMIKNEAAAMQRLCDSDNERSIVDFLIDNALAVNRSDAKKMLNFANAIALLCSNDGKHEWTTECKEQIRQKFYDLFSLMMSLQNDPMLNGYVSYKSLIRLWASIFGTEMDYDKLFDVAKQGWTLDGAISSIDEFNLKNWCVVSFAKYVDASSKTRTMLAPIVLYALQSLKEDNYESYVHEVPTEIDDNYVSPESIKIDWDIAMLINVLGEKSLYLKREEIRKVLSVLIKIDGEDISFDKEKQQLLEYTFKQLEATWDEWSDNESATLLYDVYQYIQEQMQMSFFKFISIDTFPPALRQSFAKAEIHRGMKGKIAALKLMLNDFIVILEQLAREEQKNILISLEKDNLTYYKEVLSTLRIRKHDIYKACELDEKFKVYYDGYLKQEEARNANVSAFEASKKEHEGKQLIMLFDETVLRGEVDAVKNYLALHKPTRKYKHPETITAVQDDWRYNIFYLEPSTMRENLKYDTIEYAEIRFFSPFAIWICRNHNSDAEIDSFIKQFFAVPVFIRYACVAENCKDVAEYIKEDASTAAKIRADFEANVSVLIADSKIQTIHTQIWIEHMYKCIDDLYGGRAVECIKVEQHQNLMFYPMMSGSMQGFSDIDKYLSAFGDNRSEAAQFILENYGNTPSEYSRGCVLGYLIGFLEHRRDEALLDAIFELIRKETKRVIGLSLPKGSYNAVREVLCSFWNNACGGFLNGIIDMITPDLLSKYQTNRLAEYIIKYSTRFASIEQKKTIIARFDGAAQDAATEDYFVSLGESMAICKRIDEFTNGKLISVPLFDGPTIGFMEKDEKCLDAYCKLLQYCTDDFDKLTERRNILLTYAIDGIRLHKTEKSSPKVTRVMRDMIQRAQKAGWDTSSLRQRIYHVLE